MKENRRNNKGRKQEEVLLVLLFAVMTLHNISHCIYQDVAQISPSLFLTIFLIKDIQLGVAGQTFEVSVKKRLRLVFP